MDPADTIRTVTVPDSSYWLLVPDSSYWFLVPDSSYWFLIPVTGVTSVELYHSAVPGENIAFNKFATMN